MSYGDEGDMPTDGRISTASVAVHVFGGLRVSDTGRDIALGGPKQRRLLALLVARAGETVSIDWLSEYLWTDDERPDPTAPALRTYVSRLRRSLPVEAKDWVETQPSGYRFLAPDEVIEHRRFEMLRTGATRAHSVEDPLTAQTLLDEALGMWRGEPFAELEDCDWARPLAEQLRIDRLEMMEERWDAALALGHHTQVTGELAAFTAEHGLRERAVGQYALALHRSGRTPEALRVIDGHRRLVADQTGLDPSPEIFELEQALLRGDDSLRVETVGRPLRGYRLLEKVGHGEFSVVWRAVQPSVDREVAVKQIRAELATQPEFIRRFEAEAQAVARIEHPHIVPMIDFWRDPDSAYLVLRWMRGGTLGQRLASGPLDLTATLAIATQVGGALSAAHARGVVHRDVRTANILLDDEGRAYLGDFGIAVDVMGPADHSAARSGGSPAYAPPEQLRREPLGPRADLFSLGVVLYKCLAGSLPFRDSASVEELVDRQLHAPFPPLSTWQPGLPTPVVDAIATATAKDPDDRFGSIGEFLRALEPDATSTATTPTVAGGVVENPYLGLRAFGDGERDRFFGRERLVEELVARLEGAELESRCLVVVGPSGSGKSSVVRAGLLPSLRAGMVEGSAEWFATAMVPGEDPFEALEAALLRIAVNPPPSLIGQLRDGERGILRGVRRCLGSDDDTVLLLVDQFEELFTGASAEDADDFLDALAIAVRDPDSPLRLIVTLRADYYHRPLEHPGFAPVLKATSVDVTPMSADELERAIVEPAARVGVGFDAGLVARIVADTSGQPSPLPLLQYALRELFEGRQANRITLAAYEELGGLGGALTTHAERLYAEADPSQRTAVRAVFGRLVDPGEETSDLRRRLRVGDLDADPAAGWVLDRFGAARLLSFDREATTREPTVEVAHEALLREWPRLVAWLQEDAELLRAADALANAASVWDAGGRDRSDLIRGGRLEAAIELQAAAPDRLRVLDRELVAVSASAAEEERAAEARRVRRLRRLVVALGAVLVVAVIAGGFAYAQQRRADDQAARAEVAKDEAETQAVLAREQTEAAVAAAEAAEIATMISRSAALASENPTIAILLALEAHRRVPGPETEQAVLNALGSGTSIARLASRERIPDPNCGLRGTRSPDGSIIFTTFGLSLVSGSLVDSSSRLRFGDLVPTGMGERGDAPEPCVAWAEAEFTGSEGGLRWAHSEDGLRLWLGPYGGPFEAERDFDRPTFVVGEGYTSAQHLVAATAGAGGGEVGLLDARTGEWIGARLSVGAEVNAARISPDGTRVAVGAAAAGDGGELVVMDGTDGTELVRLSTAAVPVALAWDEPAGEVVTALSDRSVLTIDVVSGEVVGLVYATTTAPIFDLGIRDDGGVVVASESQVEFLDRRAGPIGRPSRLRNALFAFLRSDGRLVVLTVDQRAELFDLESGPLVDRAHAVDPFHDFSIDEGWAVATMADRDQLERVELETGERSRIALRTAEGDPFTAVRVSGEVDGAWAIDESGILGRWRDGRFAGSITLGSAPEAGHRWDDWWAVVGDGPDGRTVELVRLESGGPESMFRLEAPDAIQAHPTPDGGVHVIDVDGWLRSFDAVGELVGELDLREGAFDSRDADIERVALDPVRGRLALAGEREGVMIVDPASGDVDRLPVSDVVANLGFARDGELLVIVGRDGTVRLWDVARGESAGIVFLGTGAVSTGSPWYDDDTESVWVNTSGRLLQVVLDPESWLGRACIVAGRNFTQQEWDRYVPGDRPLWFSCLDVDLFTGTSVITERE